MLYNEERPKTFDEVVGQDEIIQTLRNQSLKQNFSHCISLNGHWGSGKTTVAKIISKAANCLHPDENGNPCNKCESCLSIENKTSLDVIEVDAASNNGVEQVKELIESSQYRPVSSKYRIYIIDEYHMLSTAAFNALLKTLEECPSYCIWIFCTTEKHKVPFTILSRCAQYNFKEIHTQKMNEHIKKVSLKHGFTISDDAVRLISKSAKGAMRDALSILEQCMSVSNDITSEIAKNVLGIDDTDTYFNLLNSIVSNNIPFTISSIQEMHSTGKNLEFIFSDLLYICSDLVVFHSTRNKDQINNTENYLDSIRSLARLCTIEKAFVLTKQFSEIKYELKKDNSLTTVNVKLIQMMYNLNSDYSSLLARISELENQVSNLYQNNHLRDENQSRHIDIINTIHGSDKSQLTENHFADLVDDNPIILSCSEYDEVTEPKVSNDNENDGINYNSAEEISYQCNSSESESLLLNNEEYQDSYNSFEEKNLLTESMDTTENHDSHTPSLFSFFGFDIPGNKTASSNINSLESGSCKIGDQDSNKEKDCTREEETLVDNNILSTSKGNDELTSLMQDDTVFESAVKYGCIKDSDGENVILKTPFLPIHRIINKFLEVRTVKNIKVVLDTSILNI